MSLSKATKARIRLNKNLRSVPGRKAAYRAVKTLDEYFTFWYPPKAIEASLFARSPLLELTRVRPQEDGTADFVFDMLPDA